MDVGVDGPGKNEEARGVEETVGLCLPDPSEGRYLFALDKNIAGPNLGPDDERPPPG